jgi:hypothetical protein
MVLFDSRASTVKSGLLLPRAEASREGQGVGWKGKERK